MFALLIYLQAWFQTAQQNPSQFNNFLLLAYAAMWLVVVVYLVSLANKQRNLHQEIRLMQQLLKEDEGDE
ncbi:MAG TPA: CcmD family protein [Candidatus Sulfomarinibacteraceae bacterium]|nr:CcmD family protein [Candidatus Sulfomarinibacteraceae bacterium]